MNNHKFFIPTTSGYLSWEAIHYLEWMGGETLIIDSRGVPHRSPMTPEQMLSASNGGEGHGFVA